MAVDATAFVDAVEIQVHAGAVGAALVGFEPGQRGDLADHDLSGLRRRRGKGRAARIQRAARCNVFIAVSSFN